MSQRAKSFHFSKTAAKVIRKKKNQNKSLFKIYTEQFLKMKHTFENSKNIYYIIKVISTNKNTFFIF